MRIRAPARAPRRPVRCRAVAVAVVIALDQVDQAPVVAGSRAGDVHKFLPGVNLVHVRNTGVAFGFFSGGGALVLVLTLAALAALLVYFVLRPRRPLAVAADRAAGRRRAGQPHRPVCARLGHRLHQAALWPAFNIADMAITFGVLALLYVLEGPRAMRPQ